MMYFVRMTRSRSNATRLGELSSSEKSVSAGDDRMPAPKIRKPSAAWIKPELDRVPIKAREIVQLAALHGAAASLAIGLEEIGIDRIGEQRHVAEDIVEDVRLLKIIELVLGPDECRGGKAAVRQMLEESVVGDEPRDRHHAPAGDCGQALAQIGEIGDA